MRQQAFWLLLCALGLSSCGNSGLFGGGYSSGADGQSLLASNAMGPSDSKAAVALLVPVSGPRAAIGQVLVQAAQLALADGGQPALDVLDTAGTPQGAATAAQQAATNRDAMILGPLTSAETASVTPVAHAANTPVLAFTNDGTRAQPGVWPLGITADQQVRRLVSEAQSQGKTRFAALLPDNGFGHAMANALNAAASSAGLQAPVIRMHPPGIAAITAATRDVSDYANRRGPIDAKIKAARALATSEGRREAQDLAKTPIPPPPFDVLLLADGGDELQEIAALLPYYDVDRSVVQIVGPALWSDPATGSATVGGAWYAAPDGSARTAFAQAFSAKFGTAPPAIADLAYDAALVAHNALGQHGGDPSALIQPGGFVGSDGWFALGSDGQVRRGLAVFKVERGGPQLIGAAPQSASALGF